MKAAILPNRTFSTCLPMSKAIELVERAFHQLADGTAINHPRRRVILPTGSVLHYMAAGTPDYFGLKAYSVNAKTGAHFEVLLYRSRTACLSRPSKPTTSDRFAPARPAVWPRSTWRAKMPVWPRSSAADFRPKPNSKRSRMSASFAKCGSGAGSQSGASSSRAAAREKFKLNVKATETARECVEGADIVVTATSSKEPVFESDWIAPGTHVNAHWFELGRTARTARRPGIRTRRHRRSRFR